MKKLQSDLSKSLLEADKYRSLYEVLRDEKFIGTSQKSVTSRREHGLDDDKVCTSGEESVSNSGMVDFDSASTSPNNGNAVSDQAIYIDFHYGISHYARYCIDIL